MDDATLRSLEAALAATPDNVELRAVVVDALLERDEIERAAEAAAETPLSAGEAARTAAARALRAADRCEEALALATGDQPATLLERAHLLERLDRRQEGLDAYRRAVARNAALEDPDLRQRLGATIHAFPGRDGTAGAERPALRVLSNDDTTDSEMSRLLAPEREQVKFSDVGGLDEVKRQIRKRIILPFQKPSLFERFKKRIGGGILLYGPPGCGKTLLARATAGEVDARFFDVAISDVLDMYIGESEQKLHALFEKARAETPSVLFFDEIEALGGKRQYTREATSSKLVSQFLAEMDGFAQNNTGVLVLGATNVPWAVDAAFRRPGRFDRLMFVPPPDRAARRAILELHLTDRPTEETLDVAKLEKLTSGFSGADLADLVETAADEAIEESLERGEERPIASEHLLRALREVRPTTAEWLTTARNYARYANEGGQYDDVLDFLKRHAR
ncbi:MAG: ATP-binding protein [Acidobacteriota bacterium]